MKSIKSLNFIDKNVLVRCDLNVPLDTKGNILDDFKIREALPTIQYLLDKHAKIILAGHLGEPNGKVVLNLKMDKVAEKLSEYLNSSIMKTDNCVGPEIETYTNKLQVGNILLLENLRFHKEEEDGDLEFAKKLSFLCDIFINDAFSECHKIYASTAGVPQYLSSGAGLLLEKEINNLNKIIQNPEKPLVVIIGGEIEETKLKFIDTISKVADWVMVSGLIKGELIKKEILFKHQDKIIGPVNFMDNPDIDENTIKIFKEKIMQAKTVVLYDIINLDIANAIVESKAFSVAGGKMLIEFLLKQGLTSKFSHISAGGQSMLKYLNGDELPGLVLLK